MNGRIYIESESLSIYHLYTHHSLTQVWHISEEGNTGTRQKKKTTAVGSASYCFWGLKSCGDSIFEEVAGFSPFMVSPIKTLCVSCLL